ncbi:MAG TPA: AAA family ATPase [Spirochaetia bacterium]
MIPLFPFSAVVGQESAKRALLLLLIEPRIGGLLLCGPPGSAKSTLARSASTLLSGGRLVTVPRNVTEDRLLGSLDVEAALRSGEARWEEGLLQEADGNILYVDEVNLLPRAILSDLLDCAATGRLRVEREGMSAERDCRFALLGTMNPREGRLPPQALDRFGLCAVVSGETGLEERMRIVSRRLCFERDPEGFLRACEREECELRERVEAARALLPEVTIGDDLVETAVRVAREANADGARGELCLVYAARASAAWEGRKQVETRDIETAAPLALAHRTGEREPDRPEPKDAVGEGGSSHTRTTPSGDGGPAAPGGPADGSQPAPDEVFPVERAPQEPSLRGERRKRRPDPRDRSGRSVTLVDVHGRGRYVRSRASDAKPVDIAVDATLREAVLRTATLRAAGSAPPPANGTIVTIQPRDLRIKVREIRTGDHILFLIDGSGSMGARRRMGIVKGAIASLFEASYRQRDTVAVAVFRGDDARLVLPPTRSFDRARRLLHDMPVGGKTPLALGIAFSVRYVLALRSRQSSVQPTVVLVTDGRGNLPFDGRDPEQATREAALRASRLPARYLVIDTEEGWGRTGSAARVGRLLGARCIRLGERRHT